MRLMIALSILSGIAQVNCGFFDGMNIGLKIPAMTMKVPAPGIPQIKVDAQVKMPPKQSLSSFLPKFKYNIPTFDDEYHPMPPMHIMHPMQYASSDQHSVGIPHRHQSNQIDLKKFNNHQHSSNYQLNNPMASQVSNQINYQASNQINRFNDKINSQSSNQKQLNQAPNGRNRNANHFQPLLNSQGNQYRQSPSTRNRVRSSSQFEKINQMRSSTNLGNF